MLNRRRGRRANRIWEGVSLPLTAFLVPILFVLVLIVCFLRQLALDAGRLTRKMIASSREFIADAEAVRLTQNPAALVSALRRIDGRSRVDHLAAGGDAMMIDGDHHGALATHPTIAARIDAIVAVTGSMALIAPARRDTRAARPVTARAGFGLKGAAGGAVQDVRGAAGAEVRPSAPERSDYNRLGLTREMSFGAVAAVFVLIAVRGPALGPAGVAGMFDPRPLRMMFAAAGAGARCNASALRALATHTTMPKACSAGEGSHRRVRPRPHPVGMQTMLNGRSTVS